MATATKPVQIPGVAPVVLQASDLDDPNLEKVNEVFRQIHTSLNALVGANGKVPFSVSIDMQGNPILNAGLSGAAPVVGVGQVGLGSQTAPTATAGGGQAVPGTVLGYLLANIGGVAVKIPYFKA
jgi:hypothetical protein